MSLIVSSFSQGLFWAIMAIGVFITFRILDIADLTAEGSFPLGAAAAASLIVAGVNPLLATLLAVVAGALAGLVAGFLHTKMQIPAIITGILVLTGLYSINIRVMGQSNLALLNEETLLTYMQDLGLSVQMAPLVLGVLSLALVIGIIVWFMNTEYGLALRTTGDNKIMAEANGIETDSMIILGYMISNSMIALSGALLAQYNGYSDISMGTGTIVIGLAGVVIAEVLVKDARIFKRLLSIFAGAFIYRLVIDMIMRQTAIAITPSDIKIISAVILAVILWAPQVSIGRKKKKVTERRG